MRTWRDDHHPQESEARLPQRRFLRHRFALSPPPPLGEHRALGALTYFPFWGRVMWWHPPAQRERDSPMAP
jgi:hypothetical protein